MQARSQQQNKGVRRSLIFGILGGYMLLLIMPSVLQAEPAHLEDLRMVSFAQDMFRQKGYNISRGALELRYVEGWGRVFYINIEGRRTTIMDDILASFLIGGALSQHAPESFDQIVVIGTTAFKENEIMVLSASGKCCEDLYNNLISIDMFSDRCLFVKE